MPFPSTVEVSIELQAPIWRVYQNWKRLERFPQFISSVRQARWLSKTELLWVEEHQGQLISATFEVLSHPEQNSLTWRTLTGPPSAGTAVAQPHSSGRTTLTLTIHFQPDEQSQTPSAVRRRHQEFLDAFRQVVERSVTQK